MSWYAVWQVNGPVYGIGQGEDRAIADAREWIDENADDLFDGPPSRAHDGAIIIVPCSTRLAWEVQQEGGGVRCTLDGEALYLTEELA